MQDLDLYLQPTYFIDNDEPSVKHKALELAGGIIGKTEQAKALFYYVRDEYFYYPYDVIFDAKQLKASCILNRRASKKRGYCIEKALLFAAFCRVLDIPNRLIFCNVRNHIATGKVEEVLGTDLMVFHGYNEVFLNDKWVKCTVAFNKTLCDKLNVDTLEFDGKTDEVFQEFNKEGGQFMVYEHEYGTFHDLPYDLWEAETRRLYPHLFKDETQKEFLKMAKDEAEKL